MTFYLLMITMLRRDQKNRRAYLFRVIYIDLKLTIAVVEKTASWIIDPKFSTPLGLELIIFELGNLK